MWIRDQVLRKHSINCWLLSSLLPDSESQTIQGNLKEERERRKKSWPQVLWGWGVRNRLVCYDLGTTPGCKRERESRCYRPNSVPCYWLWFLLTMCHFHLLPSACPGEQRLCSKQRWKAVGYSGSPASPVHRPLMTSTVRACCLCLAFRKDWHLDRVSLKGSTAMFGFQQVCHKFEPWNNDWWPVQQLLPSPAISQPWEKVCQGRETRGRSWQIYHYIRSLLGEPTYEVPPWLWQKAISSAPDIRR